MSGRRARPRGEWLAGGALVLAAVLGWALVRTYPAYDSYFALLWGRELLEGAGPVYDVYAAPTPHPAWTGAGAGLSLLGQEGERALVLVTVLAWAALVWGTARFAAALWDGPRGLLAAAFVASSSAFLLYAARAYVDVPFLALVAWAAALEQERPRRGASVQVLLALAGLLRPEAWLLAAAYGIWLWRGGRRTFAVPALALAGPVLWLALDALATGDPLFSLHRTSSVVQAVNEEVPLAQVPQKTVTFLAATARPPVLALGLLGAGLALWRRGWRRLAVALVLALGGFLAFVAAAAAVGTAQQRYLTVPALAVCVFAAHGLLGFRDEGGRLRRWWRAGAVAAAVLGVAGAALLAPELARKLSAELRYVRESRDALLSVVDNPRVRSCRPIVLPTFRGVPDARWALAAGRRDVVAAPVAPPRGGARITVQGTDRDFRRFGRAAGVPARTNVPDPALPVLAQAGPFTARGRC